MINRKKKQIDQGDLLKSKKDETHHSIPAEEKKGAKESTFLNKNL